MSQSILDHPKVLNVLFHPRPESGFASSTQAKRPIAVEIEPDVIIGGRLYPAGPQSPAILFFHGNGEIAADYDDIAPLYTQRDITLFVVDYRGYGMSTGAPTATNLISDAVNVFEEIGQVFTDNGLSPSRLFVMGRSLGSAAAIEVALQVEDQIDGLIIESGFAETFALLTRLGVRVEGTTENKDGFGNLSKIGKVTTPTLIIHGENDVLIPPEDGQQLYGQSGADDKQLVRIPGAGHNDLMYVGMEHYFREISNFIHRFQ